jgi:hypothetical protein
VSSFNWTGDGLGILYWRHAGPVSGAWSPGQAHITTGLVNIWLQPTAGGEPRNLGGFSGAQVRAMSLSPGGQRIAVYRTIFSVESLLITDGQK